MPGHGGKRANSGRKPGSVTKRTRELANAIANRPGLLPLTYMLEVLEDPNATQQRRDQFAVAAAPYVHPRLGAITALDNSSKLSGIAVVNIITVPCETFLSREMADQAYRFQHDLEGGLTIRPVWTSPTLVADRDRDRDLVTVEDSSNDDAA